MRESVAFRAARRGTSQALRVVAAKKRLNRMRLGKELRTLGAKQQETIRKLDATANQIYRLREKVGVAEQQNRALQNAALVRSKPTVTGSGLLDYRKIRTESLPREIQEAKTSLDKALREHENLLQKVKELTGDMNLVSRAMGSNDRAYKRYYGISRQGIGMKIRKNA